MIKLKSKKAMTNKKIIIILSIILGVLLIYGLIGAGQANKIGVDCDIGVSDILCFKWHKNIIGELFNIGTGINYNIFDLVECISGKKDIIEDKDFVFVPERIGEVKESLADITKAKEILRWNPRMELKNWIEETKIQ